MLGIVSAVECRSTVDRPCS